MPNNDISKFIDNYGKTLNESPNPEWLNQDKGSALSYTDKSLSEPYIYQDNFDKFGGFNPSAPRNKEYAIQKETWGSALGKGFDSFGSRFSNTFVDYWKDYGRMAEAIVNLDWSKMMPSQKNMIEQYYEDQKDANKNMVFVPEEDEDGIFNKKFASEMISNAGFMAGTTAGFFTELVGDSLITLVTAGGGGTTFGATFARLGAKLGIKSLAKKAATEGAETIAKKSFVDDIVEGMFKLGAVDEKTLKRNAAQLADDAADVSRASRTTNKEALRSTVGEVFENSTNTLLKLLNTKSLSGKKMMEMLPIVGGLYTTANKVKIASEVGMTSGKMIGIGLYGLRRAAQEINMASTEASFEAISSYGDTLDRMINQYKIDHNGEAPSGEEIIKMEELSKSSALSNYNTNMAILLATNKIQFGNVMNKYIPAGKFYSDLLREGATNTHIVMNKTMQKAYTKGFIGTYGNLMKIAKDFGKKTALKEFGKAFLASSAKFEVVEGLQENLQEMSSSGWRSYYAGQFNGTKHTLSSAFGDALDEQFTKQGLKTFISGAFAGLAMRGPMHIASKGVEGLQNYSINRQYENKEDSPVYQAKKAQEKEIEQFNTLTEHMRNTTSENTLFNFRNQIDASMTQSDGALNNDQYTWTNGRDNALLSAIYHANNSDMVDAYIRSFKMISDNMTNEEFEKTYGISLKDTKYSNIKEFTESVVKDIKIYSDTIDKIRDKVLKLTDPMLFKPGSKEQIAAMMTRVAQEEAVKIVAFNTIKSTMAAKRSEDIAKELQSIPGMKESSDYAINIMSDARAAISEIGHIDAELRLLSEQLSNTTDKEIKKDIRNQIKSKNNERKLLEEWVGMFENNPLVSKNEKGEIISSKDVYSFKGKKSKVKRKIQVEGKGFTEVEEEKFNPKHKSIGILLTKIINNKNKQAGLSTVLDESVMTESLDKLIDYIQLDKDSKEYANAIRSLFDADNLLKTTERIEDGYFKYKVITYLDNITSLSREAINEILSSNISSFDKIKALTEFEEFVKNNEHFKAMLTLLSDKNFGMNSSKFMVETSEKLEKAIEEKIKALVTKEKKDRLPDIAKASMEELDKIIDDITKEGDLTPGELKAISDRRLKLSENIQKPTTLETKDDEVKPVEKKLTEDNSEINKLTDTKADIERRIEEVENFVNHDFFANSELLSKHWKTRKDLFENKVKQLKDLLQKGIRTGKDLRTLTNILNDIRGVLNEGININNNTNVDINEKNIRALANSLFPLISDNVIKEYIEVMNKAMESRVGSNAVEKMLVGYSDGSGYTIDGKNTEYFLSKEILENAKNNKQINARYDEKLAALESTVSNQPTTLNNSEINKDTIEIPNNSISFNNKDNIRVFNIVGNTADIAHNGEPVNVDYFEGIAKFTNNPHSFDGVKFPITTKVGKAIKQNGVWTVVEPMKITFSSTKTLPKQQPINESKTNKGGQNVQEEKGSEEVTPAAVVTGNPEEGYNIIETNTGLPLLNNSIDTISEADEMAESFNNSYEDITYALDKVFNEDTDSVAEVIELAEHGREAINKIDNIDTIEEYEQTSEGSKDIKDFIERTLPEEDKTEADIENEESSHNTNDINLKSLNNEELIDDILSIKKNIKDKEENVNFVERDSDSIAILKAIENKIRKNSC